MGLHIYYGKDFDGPIYTNPAPCRAGEAYFGPRKLLLWLEQQLGIGAYPENTEYLRIELYRQALTQWLTTPSASAFFAHSFDADRFATAATLLNWRDELILSGWDFKENPDMPERLRVLAAVEQIFQKKITAPELVHVAQGFADRFERVLQYFGHTKPNLQKMTFFEELLLQKPHIQRLAKILATHNVRIQQDVIVPAAAPETALGILQRRLTTSGSLAAPDTSHRKAQDHSIIIVKARRDSDMATALAQLIRENKAFRPFFLVPEMNLLLEQAMVQESLPALGILSASLARPSLQVLKLAPVFLWEPLDVFKVMEFVTLPVKPIDHGLALEIARVMAEKPGMNSDKWFATVYSFLESADVPNEVREQYQFWFSRRRYASDATAPKRDAIALYRYLREWALVISEKEDASSKMMLLLAEQARRICELLETLPEQRIGFLELERIVRTIYEPSPVSFQVAEAGSFGYVHQAGALTAAVPTLIWWNCLFDQAVPQPDKWSETERTYLATQHVFPQKPTEESRLKMILSQRAILQAAQQLILVVPEQVDGAEAVPGLLLGDIEATFPDYKSFIYHLDKAADSERLKQIFTLPPLTNIPVRLRQRPLPFLQLEHPELLTDSEYETPTNLENLFYYPHRWFFRQKLRLYSSSLLSVSHDLTLLGSLAHRFFEYLLIDPQLGSFDRKSLQDWVDEKATQLLEKEGATLLLYGREPERKAFLNRVKNAAWSLVSILRNNGWEVVETEKELQGFLGAVPVKGKADLVLAREGEFAIVDLKWGGATKRKELIINQEDLQLVLYAKLLPPLETWPHTAYFIMEEGKIIARNNLAFKEAVVAGHQEDHAAICAHIYAKMERTFKWRLAQIRKGLIELRNARTAAELDAQYAEQLFDLLEMRAEDNKWDEYRSLIG